MRVHELGWPGVEWKCMFHRNVGGAVPVSPLLAASAQVSRTSPESHLERRVCQSAVAALCDPPMHLR